MSERDDRYARNDLPKSTAEFRAVPDVSASTAQFRAFASGQEIKPDQSRPAGSWPEQPWADDAPSRGSGRTVALIAGAVIALVVVVVIVLTVG